MSCRLPITVALSAATVILLARPTIAQEALPPDLQAPFESIIQEMRFEHPTRIVVRLLMMDAYENAVWVEWTSRHDGANWVSVPGRRQFKLLPRNSGMMDYFRALKPGTSLKMTVQMDQDGNRRVIDLDDAT
jgi:hypothetical protein